LGVRLPSGPQTERLNVYKSIDYRHFYFRGGSMGVTFFNLVMWLRSTGAQFSPCIIAKAKFALHITDIPPHGNVKCSRQYWSDAIQAVGLHHGINEYDILLAVHLYDLYF
jgi:hypothetical protein